METWMDIAIFSKVLVFLKKYFLLGWLELSLANKASAEYRFWTAERRAKYTRNM